VDWKEAKEILKKDPEVLKEVVNLQNDAIKINDEFQEIATRTIDNRNRLNIGELAQGFNRVRL
jgi:hypothetical protein